MCYFENQDTNAILIIILHFFFIKKNTTTYKILGYNFIIIFNCRRKKSNDSEVKNKIDEIWNKSTVKKIPTLFLFPPFYHLWFWSNALSGGDFVCVQLKQPGRFYYFFENKSTRVFQCVSSESWSAELSLYCLFPNLSVHFTTRSFHFILSTSPAHIHKHFFFSFFFFVPSSRKLCLPIEQRRNNKQDGPLQKRVLQ